MFHSGSTDRKIDLCVPPTRVQPDVGAPHIGMNTYTHTHTLGRKHVHTPFKHTHMWKTPASTHLSINTKAPKTSWKQKWITKIIINMFYLWDLSMSDFRYWLLVLNKPKKFYLQYPEWPLAKLAKQGSDSFFLWCVHGLLSRPNIQTRVIAAKLWQHWIINLIIWRLIEFSETLTVLII